MGLSSNLLYLLLLYAVLDKDGKLGTSTGLQIGIGIMVATNCLNGNNNCNNNNNNGCGCQRAICNNGNPYYYGYGINNPAVYGNFLYNNALI